MSKVAFIYITSKVITGKGCIYLSLVYLSVQLLCLTERRYFSLTDTDIKTSQKM
jgi:hypothetical protein